MSVASKGISGTLEGSDFFSRCMVAEVGSILGAYVRPCSSCCCMAWRFSLRFCSSSFNRMCMGLGLSEASAASSSAASPLGVRSSSI